MNTQQTEAILAENKRLVLENERLRKAIRAVKDENERIRQSTVTHETLLLLLEREVKAK